MSKIEKVEWALVIGVVAAIGLIIWIGRNQNVKFESIALVCSLCLTGAVLVDSLVTRRDARNSIDRTLADAKQAREAADRPLIIAYISRTSFLAMFTLQNYGTVPATDIRFTFDQPISSSVGDAFSEMTLVKNGMASMTPGFRLEIPLPMTLLDLALQLDYPVR